MFVVIVCSHPLYIQVYKTSSSLNLMFTTPTYYSYSSCYRCCPPSMFNGPMYMFSTHSTHPPHLTAPPQVPPTPGSPHSRPTAPALYVQWPCHTSQITNVFNFCCATIISVPALDLWTILMLQLMDIRCC
jgi:hypothetical protein